MKRINLLLPLLLGALLTSTLVGVAGARPNARPEASPNLQNYMFSTHHCTVVCDSYAFRFTHIGIQCDNPICEFICPIKPPHEGLIRVQRLALCIWLWKVHPKDGSSVMVIGNWCSSDDPADPKAYPLNLPNFKVSVLQDISVWVYFSGITQRLYGFKVRYEPL
jgi:hypothetical protein